MRLQTYKFRLKTESETYNIQQKILLNSNNLLIYFKGEQGLTQTLVIPLAKLNKEIYESTYELLDVGNLSIAHVKLDGNKIRWKLNSIELERENDILNFPINRWLDSDRNQKLDILVKEGPVQLAPIYTVIVHTGTISSCSEVNIQLALIGDGASTLPFNLNTNSNLIQCTTKNFFQSGSNEILYISPFESIDVGQLFHLQLWCDSGDQLPYYCESVEVVNNLNNEKYFFLVNQWFGPNLEQYISVPVIDQGNIFTVSIKTTDISDPSEKNMVYIQMKFNNGKSYEEVLSLSETHQIPFQKDNTDFFMFTIDDVGHNEIINTKVCFVNKSKKIQWNCGWIEIRDIFYQRNYCYILRNTIINSIDKEPYDYTALERVTDLPCSKNLDI